MRRRVLIVPDKFKGTLTAYHAAGAIARGWSEVRGEDELVLLPMSDGGDGFGEVMAGLLQLDTQSTATVDAAHNPWEATWWFGDSKRIAVIESARVIGLALLPPQRYHPFELDTYGLGAVLQAAVTKGAVQQLVGIGGSSTNDAGFGLARAAGWRFIDHAGKTILRWTELDTLAALQPPKVTLAGPKLLVAVDVQNPLLGERGATRVYGPQKGLLPTDFARAEACLSRLADVTRQQFGNSVADEPGTGAAGGLGFGLRCFLEAQLESGFELYARYAELEKRIRSVDLVITGEGAVDTSTLMGKGVGEVARLCRQHGVPCVGLAGTVRLDSNATGEMGPFNALSGIAPTLAPAEEAQAHPELWLGRLAALAAQQVGSK